MFVIITSCAGGRHNMPRPLQVDLLTLKAVSESRATWATSIANMPEQVPPGELMRRYCQLAGAEAYCAPHAQLVSYKVMLRV